MGQAAIAKKKATPQKPKRKKAATKKKPATPRKKAPVKKRPAKKTSPRKAGRPSSREITDGTKATKSAEANRRDGIGKIARDNRRKYREIAPAPWKGIDWERRLACKHDLKLFLETYVANIFDMPWADYHNKLIASLERIFISGGKKAVAVPRGGGKTAVCRGSILWGTCYAHKKFPFFIGAKEKNAIETVDFLKTYWYRNPLLKQDFPEVAHAVEEIDGRWQGSDSQVYNDLRTEIQWGSSELRYPYLLLDKREADEVLKHDPYALQWISQLKKYMPVNSGIIIRTAGIDGSIRGEAATHSLTLEQPRPDIVLLDDIQKDSTAESPIRIAKMVEKVDGAVNGLAGPSKMISVIMPCTVIREGDVADTYLNHELRPQWDGLRCPMVESWPEGITDGEIGHESPAGKKWHEYIRLRKVSLRERNDISLATEYYAKPRNFRAMNKGFACSWPERFNGDESLEGNRKISAQQNAMNLRLENPITFASEYQNSPRSRVDGVALTTARAFAEKTTSHIRYEVPANCEILTAFIDVQSEILFYCVCAWEMDFTGHVIDYGTYPKTTARNFTRNQTKGWKLLSTQYWRESGLEKPPARDNKPEAEVESRIYTGVMMAVSDLLQREYMRPDTGTAKQINLIGVDTRAWSESVKRVVADMRDPRVTTYFGQFVGACSTQLEDRQRVKGWLFEDHVNRQTKDVKWIHKPSPTGYGMHLLVDVNRVKTFVFNRLAVPLGSPGSLSLFQGENNVPEDHEMFTTQVCDSEYPVESTKKGVTKDEWEPRPDKNNDNDYLDCLVGCASLASREGCEVMGQTAEHKPVISKGIGQPKGESRQKKTGLGAAWKKKRGA